MNKNIIFLIIISLLIFCMLYKKEHFKISNAFKGNNHSLLKSIGSGSAGRPDCSSKDNGKCRNYAWYGDMGSKKMCCTGKYINEDGTISGWPSDKGRLKQPAGGQFGWWNQYSKGNPKCNNGYRAPNSNFNKGKCDEAMRRTLNEYVFKSPYDKMCCNIPNDSKSKQIYDDNPQLLRPGQTFGYNKDPLTKLQKKHGSPGGQWGWDLDGCKAGWRAPYTDVAKTECSNKISKATANNSYKPRRDNLVNCWNNPSGPFDVSIIPTTLSPTETTNYLNNNPDLFDKFKDNDLKNHWENEGIKDPSRAFSYKYKLPITLDDKQIKMFKELHSNLFTNHDVFFEHIKTKDPLFILKGEAIKFGMPIGAAATYWHHHIWKVRHTIPLDKKLSFHKSPDKLTDAEADHFVKEHEDLFKKNKFWSDAVKKTGARSTARNYWGHFGKKHPTRKYTFARRSAYIPDKLTDAEADQFVTEHEDLFKKNKFWSDAVKKTGARSTARSYWGHFGKKHPTRKYTFSTPKYINEEQAKNFVENNPDLKKAFTNEVYWNTISLKKAFASDKFFNTLWKIICKMESFQNSFFITWMTYTDEQLKNYKENNTDIFGTSPYNKSADKDKLIKHYQTEGFKDPDLQKSFITKLCPKNDQKKAYFETGVKNTVGQNTICCLAGNLSTGTETPDGESPGPGWSKNKDGCIGGYRGPDGPDYRKSCNNTALITEHENVDKASKAFIDDDLPSGKGNLNYICCKQHPNVLFSKKENKNGCNPAHPYRALSNDDNKISCLNTVQGNCDSITQPEAIRGRKWKSKYITREWGEPGTDENTPLGEKFNTFWDCPLRDIQQCSSKCLKAKKLDYDNFPSAFKDNNDNKDEAIQSDYAWEFRKLRENKTETENYEKSLEWDKKWGEKNWEHSTNKIYLNSDNVTERNAKLEEIGNKILSEFHTDKRQALYTLTSCNNCWLDDKGLLKKNGQSAVCDITKRIIISQETFDALFEVATDTAGNNISFEKYAEESGTNKKCGRLNTKNQENKLSLHNGGNAKHIIQVKGKGTLYFMDLIKWTKDHNQEADDRIKTIINYDTTDEYSDRIYCLNNNLNYVKYKKFLDENGRQPSFDANKLGLKSRLSEMTPNEKKYFNNNKDMMTREELVREANELKGYICGHNTKHMNAGTYPHGYTNCKYDGKSRNSSDCLIRKLGSTSVCERRIYELSESDKRIGYSGIFDKLQIFDLDALHTNGLINKTLKNRMDKEIKDIVDLNSSIKPWKYHDLDSKCRSWCVGQAGLGRIQRRNINRTDYEKCRDGCRKCKAETGITVVGVIIGVALAIVLSYGTATPALAVSGAGAGAGAGASATTIGAGLSAAAGGLGTTAGSVGTTLVTTALSAIPGGSAIGSMMGIAGGAIGGAGAGLSGAGAVAGFFGVGATATGALAGTTAGTVLATTSSVFGALSSIKTLGDLIYAAKTNKSYNYDNCSGEDGWAGITKKKHGSPDAAGNMQSQIISFTEGEVESWKQKDSGRIITTADENGTPLTNEKRVQFCADAFNPGRKRVVGNNKDSRENNSKRVSKEIYDANIGLSKDESDTTPREHTYFADCNQWGVNNGIPNGFCLPKYEDTVGIAERAAIGAAIGSFLPGIGTAIGAAVGSLSADGATASKHYCESGKSKLDLTSENYHDTSGQYLFQHDPASLADDPTPLNRVEIKKEDLHKYPWFKGEFLDYSKIDASGGGKVTPDMIQKNRLKLVHNTIISNPAFDPYPAGTSEQKAKIIWNQANFSEKTVLAGYEDNIFNTSYIQDTDREKREHPFSKYAVLADKNPDIKKIKCGSKDSGTTGYVCVA